MGHKDEMQWHCHALYMECKAQQDKTENTPTFTVPDIKPAHIQGALHTKGSFNRFMRSNHPLHSVQPNQSGRWVHTPSRCPEMPAKHSWTLQTRTMEPGKTHISVLCKPSSMLCHSDATKHSALLTHRTHGCAGIRSGHQLAAVQGCRKPTHQRRLHPGLPRGRHLKPLQRGWPAGC